MSLQCVWALKVSHWKKIVQSWDLFCSSIHVSWWYLTSDLSTWRTFINIHLTTLNVAEREWDYSSKLEYINLMLNFGLECSDSVLNLAEFKMEVWKCGIGYFSNLNAWEKHGAFHVKIRMLLKFYKVQIRFYDLVALNSQDCTFLRYYIVFCQRQITLTVSQRLQAVLRFSTIMKCFEIACRGSAEVFGQLSFNVLWYFCSQMEVRKIRQILPTRWSMLKFWGM